MEKIFQFTAQNGINAVRVEGIPTINIFKTFDCGQCFRFDPVSEFGNKYEFGGVAFGKYVVFAQNNENEIIIYNSTKEEYQALWRSFLSLDTDYDEIDSAIKSSVPHEHMIRACDYSRGIRILRQDSWESVCSFIVSQNNNIPRIKKIISAMCEKYGEKIECMGKAHYSFPSAAALLSAGVEEIFALKTGFRAKYIYDAARCIENGIIGIDALKNEPSLERCIEILCQVKGIGNKVASCALLFGFGKTEAFPIDVWIKRSIDKHFGGSLDILALGKYAGIAQQYLFYYERYLGN